MAVTRLKIVLIACAVSVLVGLYLLLESSPLIDFFSRPETLVYRIYGLGALGPLLIIGLMVLAIVFNPLPSAPIAIAAGAVYGHALGTIYIVIGAEIGAIIAFLIARTIGYDLTRKHLSEAGFLGRLGSQNALTAMVFVSRLVPFLSFDLISYAAGLTVIRFWRFALATLLGLVPISFALAHLGQEIVAREDSGLAVAVLVVGIVTVVPLVLKLAQRKRQERHDTDKLESG